MRKHLYLLAYDIEDDKRRTRYAKWLEDQGGERVNYSVFELMLSQREFDQLRQHTQQSIDPKRDRVVIYPICRTCYGKAHFLPDRGVPPPKPLVV